MLSAATARRLNCEKNPKAESSPPVTCIRSSSGAVGSWDTPRRRCRFMAVSGRNEEKPDQRIKELVRYLESIQVK